MQRKHEEFVARIESRIRYLKDEKSTRPLVKPIQATLDLMKMSHDDEHMCDIYMNAIRQLLKPNYDYRIYLKSWTPPIPDHVWDSINLITGDMRKHLQPFAESGMNLDFIFESPEMLVEDMVRRVHRGLLRHYESGYWNGEVGRPQ